MVTFYQKIIKKINFSNIWTRIVIACIIFLIIAYAFDTASSIEKKNKEGFTQNKKFEVYNNDNLYDDFYSSIYDELVYDLNKNSYEVGELIRATKMNKSKSIILDIGCGTGHHVKTYQNVGFETHGIDNSKAMIKKCKSSYPDCNFKVGNALNHMMYQPESFTHINAMYFTLYYIKNKKLFFENCYSWLKPGGYLNIHLVNRDKFNPIINVADPLIYVSPQKYSKKRITNSLVKFKDFQYRADFKYNDGDSIATFEELFKDDATNNVRKNEHTFYMDTQKNILKEAKQTGFILEGKIDMVYCKYEYQYIYILRKPE